MTRLQQKIKFKWSYSELEALLRFAIHFDDAKAVDRFDFQMKLIKVNTHQFCNRLAKKYLSRRDKYTLSVPSHEAMALCLAAQALGNLQGEYEKLILFDTVNKIQQFYYE